MRNNLTLDSASKWRSIILNGVSEGGGYECDLCEHYPAIVEYDALMMCAKCYTQATFESNERSPLATEWPNDGLYRIYLFRLGGGYFKLGKTNAPYHRYASLRAANPMLELMALSPPGLSNSQALGIEGVLNALRADLPRGVSKEQMAIPDDQVFGMQLIIGLDGTIGDGLLDMLLHNPMEIFAQWWRGETIKSTKPIDTSTLPIPTFAIGGKLFSPAQFSVLWKMMLDRLRE